MSAHLEGWRVSAGDDHLVFDANQRKLASIPVGGMAGRTFREGAEQARLIAAAPDLLAALEGLVEIVETTERRKAKGVGVAKAAIAKARGQA